MDHFRRRSRIGCTSSTTGSPRCHLRAARRDPNLRTSSPSAPSSRARASPIWWRPSIASPTPSPTSAQDRRAAGLGRGRAGAARSDPPATGTASTASDGATTGARSSRGHACSPTPRCTRASGCHRSRRCPSASRWSPPRPGAIPEVVGDAAVLVPPRDVPALAEALLVAAQDTTTRERLIARGTERVRLFSWQRAGEQLARALPLAGRCPSLKPRAGAVHVQTSTHAVGSSGHRVPDDAWPRTSGPPARSGPHRAWSSAGGAVGA